MEHKTNKLPAGVLGAGLATALVAGVCWLAQPQQAEVSVTAAPMQSVEKSGLLERAEKAGLEMEQRMQKCMAGWGYRHEVRVPSHIYDSIANSSWASQGDQNRAAAKLSETRTLESQQSGLYAGNHGYKRASSICRDRENKRNDDIRENMAKAELASLKALVSREGGAEVLETAAELVSSQRSTEGVSEMPATEEVRAIVEAYTTSRPEYQGVLSQFSQCAKKHNFDVKTPNELGSKYSDRLSPFVPRDLTDDQWQEYSKKYEAAQRECQPIVATFEDKIQQDLYDRS